jgi:hypothetical protein
MATFSCLFMMAVFLSLSSGIADPRAQVYMHTIFLWDFIYRTNSLVPPNE